MVSIVSLIYKSSKYAEFLVKGIEKWTPMLRSAEINGGELIDPQAEFYFIVNKGSGTLEENFNVIKYLKEKNIPHYIFETPPQKPYPQNLKEIYKAWNFAVEKARGEIVVLLNSDMWVSKNWLENLIKNLDRNKVITSRLVESGRIPSIFPHTLVKNFGQSPEEFNAEDFEMFTDLMKVNMLMPKGTFMPIAIYKDVFLKAGKYPEGNVNGIGGDYYFFYKVLEPMGVKHYTAMDSLVYHIQEGEVRE